MHDSTVNPNPDRSPSPLNRLVLEHKVFATLALAAITSAPDFLAIPLVNRFEVWAGVLAFIALSYAVHRGVSMTVVKPVGWAVAGVLFLLMMAGLPNETDNDSSGQPPTATATATASPTATPAATPERTEIRDDAVATLREGRHRIIVFEDGTMDRYDGQSRTATFKVEGPVEAVTSCAGAVIVTHADGKVARVHPATGLEVDYPYALESGAVTCGGNHVFVSKPDEGTVVQLTARAFRYVDAFPVVEEVTSLTYGEGVVWLLDGRNRILVGIRAATKEKLGPFPIGDGAVEILYANGSVWILDREASCVTRFDTAHRVEVGPGVPTGRMPMRMRLADDQLLIPDYTDNSILKIDLDKVRAARPAITVGEHARLVDADQHGDALIGLDARNNLLITLTPEQQLAAEHRRGYARGKDCPA